MLGRLSFVIAYAIAALWLPLPAAAADYPSRPVTIIVAFTPGGPSDVLARIVGKRLQEILHPAVHHREPSRLRRQHRRRADLARGA